MALVNLTLVGLISNIQVEEAEKPRTFFTVTVITDKVKVPFDFVAYGELAQRIANDSQSGNVVSLTASLISTKEDQYWSVSNLSSSIEGSDSFAQITVGGVIRSDITVKHTANDKQMVKFAIPASVTGGPSTWFNFTAWNNLAKLIDSYYSKGTFVVVTGDFAPYLGNDDKPYHGYTVRGIEKAFEANSGQNTNAAPPAKRQSVEPTPALPDTDEIPF